MFDKTEQEVDGPSRQFQEGMEKSTAMGFSAVFTAAAAAATVVVDCVPAHIFECVVLKCTPNVLLTKLKWR